MVRAILDNRKTVTRRVIKPQPPHGYYLQPTLYPDPPEMNYWGSSDWDDDMMEWWPSYDKGIISPYKKGDILYVRETWRNEYIPGTHINYYVYKTERENAPNPWGYKWRPSIHMPKEAARIFLRVTDVKVGRLQDISHGGMTKEGIELPGGIIGGLIAEYSYLRSKFTATWNSTVKKKDLDKYGWDANPWVWVIEFERTEKPIEGQKG